MCNNPPLCVPHCRDYHAALDFHGRKQRAKRDQGIILQVSSRKSLEEVKTMYQKSTAIICHGCLWLGYGTPPPSVAHICRSLLRKHNIFSLRRTYGSTSVEWPIMQRCCSCLAASSHTHHSRPFTWTCAVRTLSRYLYCSKKTSETGVSREQALCISTALWTVDPEDYLCFSTDQWSLQLWNYNTSKC